LPHTHELSQVVASSPVRRGLGFGGPKKTPGKDHVVDRCIWIQYEFSQSLFSIDLMHETDGTKMRETCLM
jgi:hypothetical protein